MSFGNDPEKLKELRGIDDEKEDEEVDRHELRRKEEEEEVNRHELRREKEEKEVDRHELRREKESQRKWQNQYSS